MSTFLSALNAIKTTRKTSPGSSTSKTKDARQFNDGHSKTGSILDRIKPRSSAGNPKKVIKIHKTDSDDEDRMKVLHRIIKKDKTQEIHRPVIKRDDIEGQWKHDKYDGPQTSSNSSISTVFIRNLPDYADKDSLMGLCREYDPIGIKIDSGTAELNFSRKDQAKKASEALNGKMFRGSKLKAALMSDINTGPGKRETFSTREEVAKKKEDGFKKTHMDSVGSNKNSILNRIKKAN